MREAFIQRSQNSIGTWDKHDTKIIAGFKLRRRSAENKNTNEMRITK
jgi:hypothetical protein